MKSLFIILAGEFVIGDYIEIGILGEEAINDFEEFLKDLLV
jgi:small-conductance mechanosensitive channel